MKRQKKCIEKPIGPGIGLFMGGHRYVSFTVQEQVCYSVDYTTGIDPPNHWASFHNKSPCCPGALYCEYDSLCKEHSLCVNGLGSVFVMPSGE